MTIQSDFLVETACPITKIFLQISIYTDFFLQHYETYNIAPAFAWHDPDCKSTLQLIFWLPVVDWQYRNLLGQWACSCRLERSSNAVTGPCSYPITQKEPTGSRAAEQLAILTHHMSIEKSLVRILPLDYFIFPFMGQLLWSTFLTI